MKNTLILLPLVISIVACGQQRPTGDTYETDTFTTSSGKTLKIHALTHASMRIEYDGKEIEIDPVGKMGDRVIGYAAFPKADYNTTEGHLQFHPKGRDNGFVLTIDGLRIYLAGDTEDIPEMADLKDIDIAFLPCNQPYTMTTEQLVRAAKTLQPKTLFPYHYGQTELSGIAEALKADGIDVRIRHYE